MLADQFSSVMITIQYLSAAAGARVGVFELCDIVGVAGYHEIRGRAVARSHNGEARIAARE